jgi:hypothetical protein
MNNVARINAALAHAEGRPCLLCDGKADRVGVWVPSDELDAAFEQPANPKEKLAFGYALCSDCRAQEDAHKRVAAKLCATWGTRAGLMLAEHVQDVARRCPGLWVRSSGDTPLEGEWELFLVDRDNGDEVVPVGVFSSLQALRPLQGLGA